MKNFFAGIIEKDLFSIQFTEKKCIRVPLTIYLWGKTNNITVAAPERKKIEAIFEVFSK